MKRHSSFADSEYAERPKATRRELFLTGLDRLVPCSVLIVLIEPYYYKGARDRPEVGLTKNTTHLNTLFAMANLMLSRRKPCALDGTVAS